MRPAQAGFKSGKGGKTAADLLAELGPTFRVDIGLKSRSLAGAKPDLPAKGVRALLDTGAGANCIDDGLARSLGLPITDEGEVSGINGKTRANIYTARIYILDLDRLLFEPFAGVKLTEGEQWHRVILGRPFLRPYRMIYDAASGRVENAQA
jgi:hypothetical protein